MFDTLHTQPSDVPADTEKMPWTPGFSRDWSIMDYVLCFFEKKE